MKSYSFGAFVLQCLSFAWRLGLVLLFGWGVPLACWTVAGSLGAPWLIVFALMACLYGPKMSEGLDSSRFPWHWLLSKLEDPFAGHYDPKEGLFIVMMPMLTAGILAVLLFLEAFRLMGVIAR